MNFKAWKSKLFASGRGRDEPALGALARHYRKPPELQHPGANPQIVRSLHIARRKERVVDLQFAVPEDNDLHVELLLDVLDCKPVGRAGLGGEGVMNVQHLLEPLNQKFIRETPSRRIDIANMA